MNKLGCRLYFLLFTTSLWVCTFKWVEIKTQSPKPFRNWADPIRCIGQVNNCRPCFSTFIYWVRFGLYLIWFGIGLVLILKLGGRLHQSRHSSHSQPLPLFKVIVSVTTIKCRNQLMTLMDGIRATISRLQTVICQQRTSSKPDYKAAYNF